MPELRILITVKTYPAISDRYDELVCTGGICPATGFVRLYPVRFRYLPQDQQFRKYQWICAEAVKTTGRDRRPESYHVEESTIRVGEFVGSEDRWEARRRVILPHESQSIEELKREKRSMGLIQPAEIIDLEAESVEPQWPANKRGKLAQQRLFENRLELRRLPHRFRYSFRCNDEECRGHKLTIIDWELGALYLRLLEQHTEDESIVLELVRRKFWRQLCAPSVETYFYVGNMWQYPDSWLVLGVFWPPTTQQRPLCLTDSSH